LAGALPNAEDVVIRSFRPLGQGRPDVVAGQPPPDDVGPRYEFSCQLLAHTSERIPFERLLSSNERLVVPGQFVPDPIQRELLEQRLLLEIQQPIE
jgi:hypothetical protein